MRCVTSLQLGFIVRLRIIKTLISVKTNAIVSIDIISDETANPNPTDTGSEEVKSDGAVSLIDETKIREDEAHSLRALHLIQNSIPAVEECVEQTLENGQAECISTGLIHSTKRSARLYRNVSVKSVKLSFNKYS